MSGSSSSDAPALLQRKFLVIVDSTPECRVALRFAARRARHTAGTVSLLYVIPRGDFQQWAGVERKMREEAGAEADKALQEAARYVESLTGMSPETVVKEGRAAEEIRALAAADSAIAILVLAAGTQKEGPGPLVSMLAGAGGYPIPVTVVPGSLSDSEIDALS